MKIGQKWAFCKGLKLILIIYSALVCLSSERPVFGREPPYPASPVIDRVTWDFTTLVKLAYGSDNFPVTWADDDNQYTTWGDGKGFSGSGSKKSLGVSRISGPFESCTTTDLWDSDGKSYGIISIAGVLYMWKGPGSLTKAWTESRLYMSKNHGRSWSKAGWVFCWDDAVFHPTFLQFGKDYEGARDNFVYIYAPERKSSKWEVQKPGEISLWRVPKTHIMDRRKYQFFAGLDKNGKPIWTETFALRRPVFRDTVNGIFNTSVSYNPGIGRYLLITEHTSFARSNMGIYDAPEPWGPWTTVAFETGWGAPTIAKKTFFWNFSNKWLSPDGKEFVLIFTGVGTHDACNMVRGRFILRKNKD